MFQSENKVQREIDNSVDSAGDYNANALIRHKSLKRQIAIRT